MSRRVLVVDDEPLARARIRRFLVDKDERLEIVEAETGDRAVELIATFSPDVVFLDVSMPGMDGFEVLSRVTKRDFAVVFQTAYDEYAVKAFEENACDYLLKPFTAERFHRALDRALGVTGQTQGKIVVKYRFGLKAIDLDAIDYFISRDHYTHAATGGHEFLCEPSIAELEAKLPSERFFRVHRHCIVRLGAVSSVARGESLSITLKSGSVFPVARTRRKAFLEVFAG